DTKIGRNCVVQHGVAITQGVRSIGDNVYFGPGAKVIGGAAIGNNVRVVANSVVMTDVPDNLTVVGVPARIRWRNRASLTRSAMLMASMLSGRDGEAVDLVSMLPMLCSDGLLAPAIARRQRGSTSRQARRARARNQPDLYDDDCTIQP